MKFTNDDLAKTLHLEIGDIIVDDLGNRLRVELNHDRLVLQELYSVNQCSIDYLLRHEFEIEVPLLERNEKELIKDFITKNHLRETDIRGLEFIDYGDTINIVFYRNQKGCSCLQMVVNKKVFPFNRIEKRKILTLIETGVFE